MKLTADESIRLEAAFASLRKHYRDESVRHSLPPSEARKMFESVDSLEEKVKQLLA